jgi:CBS domain-containing protein
VVLQIPWGKLIFLGPIPFLVARILTHTIRRWQATIEDLDLPAALSLTPSDPISLAVQAAFEHDYTHLTIVDGKTRALLGYIAIPKLQEALKDGRVRESDDLRTAMVRFQRRGRTYRVLTMATPLEELEAFFAGALSPGDGQPQEFAVITDAGRRFVLGVATKADLEEFVKRRPA